MFLLISLLITLIVFGLLVVKRKRMIFLFFCVLLSLDLFLFYLFVYFAKRGGINESLTHFFYLNETIRMSMRNLILTLPQLGYLLSVGRFLFPTLMLFLALMITYPNSFTRSRYRWLIFVPATLSLLAYYPAIFKNISYDWQNGIMLFSLAWIVIYTAGAFGVLIIDILMIRPGWTQMKYFAVNFFCCFLIVVYALYCTQDGAQIYNFYSYNLPWTLGLNYLRLLMSQQAYFYIVIIYSLLAIVGLVSLYFYISDVVEMNREEMIIHNKSQTTLPATHIFVHGLKNKLLVEQAYIKKVQRQVMDYDNSELTDNLKILYEHNRGILSHLDELYYSFKNNQILLQKKRISQVVDAGIQVFHKKYPEMQNIAIDLTKDVYLMADEKILGEALGNILTNGYESMRQLPIEEQKLDIEVRSGVFNVIVSIRDYGTGLTEKEQQTIYYPFISSKNSSDNWGVGLFFSKKVIKQHSGKIYLETSKGKGTTFRIILPKRKGVG